MTIENPEAHLKRPTVFPWPPVLLVAMLAGAWGLGRVAPIAWPGIDDTPARVIGIGLGVIGVVLIVWAVIAFRQHRTTILPNQGADTLITSGPFRWRRNPIYLGEVLILLGLAEVTKNVWFVVAAVMFAVLVTALAIIPEERHLEAKFGDAYRDYLAKTRRWI